MCPKLKHYVSKNSDISVVSGQKEASSKLFSSVDVEALQLRMKALTRGYALDFGVSPGSFRSNPIQISSVDVSKSLSSNVSGVSGIGDSHDLSKDVSVVADMASMIR